jgi:hypothetical protein
MVLGMTPIIGLWQRVATRAAIGLWHHKQTLIVGAIMLAAMATYVSMASPVVSLGSIGLTGRASGSQDCADTVMAAVLGIGATSIQQQAYNCMDPSFQQRVSQQEFTTQFGTGSQAASITRVSRLGTYDSQSGADLVYYAVETPAQSVGFVVYLNPDGKVMMID